MSRRQKVQLCYWSTFIVGMALALYINSREVLWIAPHTTNAVPLSRSLIGTMLVSDFGELLIVSIFFGWLATRFLTRDRRHQDKTMWASLVLMIMMTVMLMTLVVYQTAMPSWLDIPWTLCLFGGPILILINALKVDATMIDQHYLVGIMVGIGYILMMLTGLNTSTM